MGPAKAQLIQLIEDQPDDSSPEEILRELAFDVFRREPSGRWRLLQHIFTANSASR